MMSLKPGSQVDEPFHERGKGTGNSLSDSRWSQSRPGVLQTTYIQDHQLGTKGAREDSGHTADDSSKSPVSNGEDLALCSPPRTENEVEKDVGFNKWTPTSQIIEFTALVPQHFQHSTKD